MRAGRASVASRVLLFVVAKWGGTIAAVIAQETSALSGLTNAWRTAVVCVALTFTASACERVRAPDAPPAADTEAPQTADDVRVLSWNVSDDAFVRDAAAFRALVNRANPDILLLDEVAPSATGPQLRAALPALTSEDGDWHVDIGSSGGRQRNVVISRLPLERLAEFSKVVAYPPAERDRLHARMAAANDLRPAYSMDNGIPVHGVIVLAGNRRLLVVSTDLQCCGDSPESWQEDRRQSEAREIRRRIEQVLTRTRVDGVIVSGDLNLVSTPLPMVILSGPYPPPHAGLIAADLRHLDGSETWTWDGRGTPFPSRPMDFVLYGPHALALREGYVLDSADLSPSELGRLGLEPEAASRLSSHRPLLADFAWQ